MLSCASQSRNVSGNRGEVQFPVSTKGRYKELVFKIVIIF